LAAWFLEALHLMDNTKVVSVYFNLVQYFTANKFSIKEQKIYNGKYTYYIKIFPLETQTGKTNIFYIHSPHTLFKIQYAYRIQQHPKP
jgi:hypothetical protein